MILGLVVILEDQNRLPRWHWPAFNIWLLVAALYVGIAIHEVGHLVAGALVGVDAGAISFGAFVFARQGKHWSLHFDRRRWLGGFFKPLAAAAGFKPSRCAWMVAGGPLASVALTVLCGRLYLRFGNGAWVWVGSLFWTSLSLAVISAIPFSSGLNKSDGARIWQLVRHPARTRSWIALLEIQTQEANGLRPCDWDSKSFNEVLTADVSASEYLPCQLFAFYRRLDEGSDDVALQHLESLLAASARAGKPVRHILFLEAALASATIRKQATQAREWLERARNIQKPKSLHAVEAAIAICEGRYEDAARHWQAARERIVRLRLDSGLTRSALEGWAKQESICRASRGSAGSPQT